MKKTVLAFALVAASCAFAAEKHWNPQNASDAWCGANWDGGVLFESGDSAVFDTWYQPATSYGVTLDGNVVADVISASVDTTVSAGSQTPVAYKYFRFKIEGRKGNDNGMVQVAELKLYSGDTDITQEKIQQYYDSSTVNVDGAKYPDNEAPYNLVDGNIDTKWLDRRLKDNSSRASLDAVWLAVGFSEPKQVTKYEWFTANDADARDPAAWRLQGSNDNPDSSEAIWVDLDVRSGFTATSERKTSAGKWTIDYSPTLSADEIEVSEGTTLTLGMAPVSSFAKTGAGTLVASAGISNGIDMQAGGLDLGGKEMNVTKAIVKKDAFVGFYNGLFKDASSSQWKLKNDTPAEWIIGSGAKFSGVKCLVLSPESADRACRLLIKDGGQLVTGSDVSYIQNHDLGKTVIEITGEGSKWNSSGEIRMIPSNDGECENPRADLIVKDGGELYSKVRLSWGQSGNNHKAANPEGYMLVSNATVRVDDCIDFGIKESHAWSGDWLSTGSYKAEFIDAYIWAQRIFVGRERKNVTVTFDGATFESRANSSDFLMQDSRADAPFVVTGKGLTVVANHNTVIRGIFQGDGGITKQGTDKIDINWDQHFTGALQCDSGTINDTSSGGLKFAAGAIVMNGGVMNLSTVAFTNEVVALALNGGVMHVFDNGKVESRKVGDLTLGGGFVFRFDVSSEGTDSFAVLDGSEVVVAATAENPFVFAPNVLSALPPNVPYTVIEGARFTSEDIAKFSCAEEGYSLGVDDDGNLTITHASEDRVYGGASGANWSDAVWGAEGDERFVSGDNAIFNRDGDRVKLDAAVTVGSLVANGNASITADEWVDQTPRYSKFRFHVSKTKSNNDMMQLAELELYSGWKKMIPSSVDYDKTTYSGFDNFPGTSHHPEEAVDGDTTSGSKWVDRRGGNGRSTEIRANCYIDLVYDEPFALTRYRWYTANDEQSRDPFSWEVLGYDGDKGEWVTLDAKVSENVTENRNSLAGTWEIAYDVEEQPSLRVSEAITVAEGKTLTVDAPFGGKVVKKGAGTLKVTQPLENSLVLEAGGLDLSGGSLGFSAGDLSADGVIAYYNGTFTYAVDPLDPGLNMPRLWTIGEGATVSGPTYASINTPQDGEDYEFRVDGGRLVLGGGTSWMQSNSTGKFKLSVTNGADAAFAGNLYCVASNEKVLDLAQIDIDVKDDAALSVGRNFTFGRENTKHAKVLYAALSVVGASLSVGEGLHLGEVNNDSTSRAGWYHLYFGTNSVVTVRDLKVWDDRDETTVVFDGATIKSRGEHTAFICRNDISRGSSPFEIAAGGLTIANEHNVVVADTLKGAGALTKTGGGLLKFSAGQEFTGAFTIAGPVDFNGQAFASSGVVLAPGGSIVATCKGDSISGLCPLSVDSITATAENPFAITITYDSDPKANTLYDLFPSYLGWTEEDLEKISVNGLELEIRNGKLYGVITPAARVWSNGSGDNYTANGENWDGGTAPKSYDTAVFGLAEGGTVTNDLGSIVLGSVRFASGAGEFAIDGSSLDLRSVTNNSANVQRFACAVRDSGATLGLGGSGDIAFVGGLTTGASTEITKGGAGTVTVAGKGPGGRLVLNEGGFRLKDLDDGGKTNPFSTASDSLRIAGTLDLGGATQTVTMSSTSGETFALDGFTLTNGVVKIATGNHYFAPNGSFTLCGSGTEVRIEGTDGPVLNFARGDSEGKMHVKIADGARLYSHSSQESVYVASGSGVSEVTIELQNGGRFHPDNCDTQFGRSGKTARMFGDGGKVDVNRHDFYLVGDSLGAVATVNITNGEFKAGYVRAGRGDWVDSPSVSSAVFELVGGKLDARGIIAGKVNSFRAMLDGVSIECDQDQDDYFKTDGYVGGEVPFILGAGGVSFVNDKRIGVTTSLAGAGGITVEKGTLAVSADQKYMGDTVIKSGATLSATGVTFAGSISLESGASITVPEIAEGKKFVRIAKAAAFEGVDETEKDDDGNHFFTTFDGWLCYGRRPGFSLKIR